LFDARSVKLVLFAVRVLGRAPAELRQEATTRLLTNLSTRPAQHQDMLLRMFVAGLEPNGPKGYYAKEVRITFVAPYRRFCVSQTFFISRFHLSLNLQQLKPKIRTSPTVTRR
jgi:hypothetical protein